MRARTKVTIAVVGMVLVMSFFVVGHVYAFSLQGLVSYLVEHGIIGPQKEDAARRLASFFGDTHKAEPFEPPRGSAYDNRISVSVSQLIEYSDRSYPRGATISGLLLLVHNTSSESVTLSGRSRCHVSYKILDATTRTLLFDASTVAPCISGETSLMTIAPNDTRMFEIEHPSSRYSLSPGLYRFVLEYPGYGEGEILVTVR